VSAKRKMSEMWNSVNAEPGIRMAKEGPSRMALAVGSRLGPYEIVSPLGAGGMGEVYRARDTRLDRDVAIKVLPERLAADRERLTRFEREARSASALNHPNVVTIYDVGEEGSVFYIAMELVEGKTLRELIAGGALPLRDLLQIGSQAAEGLARAHSSGILHRDLKPDNLMVSEDGFVKILDFGLAKVSDSSAEPQKTISRELTESGAVMGTVPYMSPEQAAGRPLDFRSDQFSLGCVLYEMATGKRAFDRDTAAETLAAIIREEPEPIGSLNARVPAPLCWIVERCLAKDPDQRYASTRDLARDVVAVRDRFLEASPQARLARPVNLPAQRTTFVGRARERAALKELLGQPDASVVTLTGPGGIGKTRLALEVAREIADDFRGGVHLVPLAPVNDPDAIAATISQVLGVREGTSGTPLTALREYLHHAAARDRMLLLLDGFEHLMAAALIVAELVKAGPRLKIVVTSRSPLHIYGEHEFPVLPMPVPDPKVGVEELSCCDAVSLFLQRASAVKPNFALTEENRIAIAEICARLDGLPLAIELAAARVKLLSPAAMRTRLEKRLQLLTGGARDLPARQQTLRGAIDWSYELLGPAEQRLFRRLSVFVGGFTLEAAEAVCDVKSDLELDLLDGVASLMDKSLLQELDRAGGEPRFAMLETIREYGLERLASSGEEPLTRRAHAAYFVVFAEDNASERNRGITGPPSSGQRPSEEGSGPLDQIESEHDNCLAALDWLIEEEETDWGLRLGAALFQFWEEREHLAEGRERLEQLLNLPGAAARTRVRARALFAAGVLAGDPTAARPFFEEALSISRELDDRRGVAVELNALAVGAQELGDLARSRALLEESVGLWKELGDPVAVVRGLSNLASVARLERNFSEALTLFEECLAISHQLGDRTGMAWALNHKGDVAREQGDTSSARSFYEQGLVIFREVGDQWGIAGSLGDLGNLAREQGDFAAAHLLYRESLEGFQELDHRRGIARLLDCFAGSAAAQSQPERALILAGAAAALRETIGAVLTPAEQGRLAKSLEPARAALSDAAGTSAWMEGWVMPADEAIVLAIGPA
jgi:predicted ATPase